MQAGRQGTGRRKPFSGLQTAAADLTANVFVNLPVERLFILRIQPDVEFLCQRTALLFYMQILYTYFICKESFRVVFSAHISPGYPGAEALRRVFKNAGVLSFLTDLRHFQ